MPKKTPSKQPQDAPKTALKPTRRQPAIVIKKQNRVIEFFIKSFAVILISAISAMGVGALLGVDPWKTIIIAGVVGLLRVIENIARGYLNDGQVTITEIDKAFKEVGDAADENAQMMQVY
jgi:hypothetical protein